MQDTFIHPPKPGPLTASTMPHIRSPIVLMYHGTPSEKPESVYSIEASLFAKHLKYLKQNGWNTVLFRDLDKPHLLPKKSVVLTFDDGYKDNYEGAFLPLVERDMKASWFITTDCIGGHAHWLGGQSQQTRMLDPGQLLEMHSAGMEIASHTHSHPDLSLLNHDQQLAEFDQAKTLLEQLLTAPVTSLAYPFGRFNADSLAAAELAGYKLACTTQPGWREPDSNPLLIKRITVYSGDSPSLLARKLNFVDNDVSWQKIGRYYMKRILSRLNHQFDMV
ncbi:polysaccharide deacetylase family protein [Methylomonas sp. EFPC3]|uniref:polysaccharide deacetylase family protein n=1 Tax=Methylomonas sp. EFPC3 TaxID=3021710 RepID=UPI0024167635|nr:polysaccharide deacetylase family protein [Methylomonas sp. EFPC3]WFP51649.1 polysaccharide deacetylase family protein [Methylomonas sp. EFPC3]